MADKSLFGRLKRLFGNDVIVRNIGGNQLKIVDINQIQQGGKIETNYLMDKFSRVYNNFTSMYGSQMNINYQILRSQLYSDYDVMDTEAIVSSALDVISDECTLKNNMGEVLQIRSSNENIQKILYNLFYDVLNIEFNMWSWIRQMLKYGDFFLKLEIAEKFGITNVIPFTAFHIERQEVPIEGKMVTKFRLSPEGNAAGSSGFYSVPNQVDHAGSGIFFDNHEMAHFRLITDVNFMPYGRSYIEGARKIYKQYVLMKDAMLIHRIVRAPEKRIFYINIGSIPPNDVEAFMEKTINKMKRIPYMDPQTGEYNLRFNIANMLEDYFIPIRGNDQTTKIDTAKGLDYAGIEDVQFLRDELFIALKVPKAFLGYEQDTGGKTTLAAQDVRFAHTIDRIQRIVLQELYKIALIHLYSQGGYNNEELTNFELSLTIPSIIYDQERVNLLKEQVSLANDIIEGKLLPTDWIFFFVFHLSEDTYEEYRDLIAADQKRFFRWNQIEEEGNDPLESGKSFGTPHDLASLYGRGRYNDASVPEGVPEAPKGRPKEKASDINTQGNAFGRNRLGKNNKKEIMLENKRLINSLKDKFNLKDLTDPERP